MTASAIARPRSTLAVEYARLRAENERLRVESDARMQELRASRQRIVAAGDAERRRLERDLHDGAQQRLVAVALQLRLALTNLRRDPATAEQLVARGGDELARSLEELRELARGIHPAVLEHGLAAALESRAARTPVPTAVSCQAREPLPEDVELAIEIADDGVGGADPAGGTGLAGLADRVAALDGELAVTSPAGQGTVLTAKLPVATGASDLSVPVSPAAGSGRCNRRDGAGSSPDLRRRPPRSGRPR
jgi:signal transduction histidine kinase